MNEPIDLFAATITGTVDYNDPDHVNKLINTDITLASEDKYKALPAVQEVFKNEDGSFNEKEFKKTYTGILKTYNDIADTQKVMSDVQSVHLDLGLFGKRQADDPISQFTNSKQILLSRVNNYQGVTMGLTGFNSMSDPQISALEAAQTNQILDPKTGTFLEQTPDDFSFSRNPLGVFEHTFVLDRYTEDVKDNSGNILHKKGERKMHNAKPYMRIAQKGEDLTSETVLSLQDRLTPEGSLLNKADFFDSDDIRKSAAGTIAKFAVQVAPYFIPYVNVAYTSAMVGRELLDGGSELVRAFGNLTDDNFTESDLNKRLNTLQGQIKATRGGMSEYGSSNFFSLESILGISSSVLDQLYGIRGISKLPKYITALKSQGAVAATTGLSRNMAGLRGSLDTVTGTSKAANMAAEAMSNVYFAGMAAKPIAEQSRELGLDSTHSSLLYLGTYGLMTALFKAGPFDWMTREFGLDDLSRHINKQLKDNVIPNMSLYQGLTQTEKLSKTLLANKTSLNKTVDTLFREGGATALATASGVEALEEMSEEGIQDGMKYMYNSMVDSGLITPKKGSGRFKFDDAFGRYATSGISGAIGGGIFKSMPKFESMLFGVDPNDPINQDLNWLMKNGYSDLVFEEANRMYKKGYINKKYSTEYDLDDEGNRVFKIADKEEDTANYKIHQSVMGMLNTQQTLITNAGIVPNNEIADQYTDSFNRLVDAKTHTFLRDDHNKLTDDIIAIDKQLQELKSNTLEQGVDKNKYDKLTEDKNKLLNELNLLYKGGKIPDYLAQGLYVLRPDLLERAGLKTVDKIAEDDYGKRFDMLSDDEKKVVREKFSTKVREGHEGYKTEVRETLEKIAKSEQEVVVPKIKQYQYDTIVNGLLNNDVFDDVIDMPVEELTTEELDEIRDTVLTPENVNKLSKKQKRAILARATTLDTELVKSKIKPVKINPLTQKLIEEELTNEEDAKTAILNGKLRRAQGFYASSLAQDILNKAGDKFPALLEKLAEDLPVELDVEEFLTQIITPETQAAGVKRLLDILNMVGEDAVQPITEFFTDLDISSGIPETVIDQGKIDGVLSYMGIKKLPLEEKIKNAKEGNQFLVFDKEELDKINKDFNVLAPLFDADDFSNVLEAIDEIKSGKIEKKIQQEVLLSELDNIKPYTEENVDYVMSDLEDLVQRQEQLAEAEKDNYTDDNNTLGTLLDDMKLRWANLEANFSINPLFTVLLDEMEKEGKFNSTFLNREKFETMVINNQRNGFVFNSDKVKTKVENIYQRLQELYEKSEANRRNYINNINKQNAANFNIQYKLIQELNTKYNLELELDAELLSKIDVSVDSEQLFVSDVNQRKQLYTEITTIYKQFFDKVSDEQLDTIIEDYANTIDEKNYYNDGGIKDNTVGTTKRFKEKYEKLHALQFIVNLKAADPLVFYNKLKNLLTEDNILAPVYAQEYTLFLAYNYVNGNPKLDYLETIKDKLAAHFGYEPNEIRKLNGFNITAPAGFGKTEITKNLIRLTEGTLLTTKSGTPLQTLKERVKEVHTGDVYDFDAFMKHVGFTDAHLNKLQSLLPKVSGQSKVSANVDFTELDKIVVEVLAPFTKATENIKQVLVDEATWLPAPYLFALSELEKRTGVKFIYLGDNLQQGYTTSKVMGAKGVFTPGAPVGFNISNSIIYSTPDVDSVLRTGVTEITDVQKTIRETAKKIKASRRVSEDPIETKPIPTAFDRNTIMGVLKTTADDSVFEQIKQQAANGKTVAIYTSEPNLPDALDGFGALENVTVYNNGNSMQSAEFDVVVVVDNGELNKNASKYGTSQQRQYEDLYTLSTRSKKALIFITESDFFEPTKKAVIPDVIPDLSDVAKIIKTNKIVELSEIPTTDTEIDTSKPPATTEDEKVREKLVIVAGRELNQEKVVISGKEERFESINEDIIPSGSVRLYTWFLPKRIVGTKNGVLLDTVERLTELRELQYALLTGKLDGITRDSVKEAAKDATFVYTMERSSKENMHIDLGTDAMDALPDNEPLLTLSAKLVLKDKDGNDTVNYIPIAVFPDHTKEKVIEKLSAEYKAKILELQQQVPTDDSIVELGKEYTTAYEALNVDKSVTFGAGMVYKRRGELNNVAKHVKNVDEFKNQHKEIKFSEPYVIARDIKINESETLTKGSVYMFYSFDQNIDFSNLTEIRKTLLTSSGRIGIVPVNRRPLKPSEKIWQLKDVKGDNAIKNFADSIISRDSSNEGRVKFMQALQTVLNKDAVKNRRTDAKTKNLYLKTDKNDLDWTMIAQNIIERMTQNEYETLIAQPLNSEFNKLTGYNYVLENVLFEDASTGVASDITPVLNPDALAFTYTNYISRPLIDIPLSQVFTTVPSTSKTPPPPPKPDPDNKGGVSDNTQEPPTEGKSEIPTDEGPTTPTQQEGETDTEVKDSNVIPTENKDINDIFASALDTIQGVDETLKTKLLREALRYVNKQLTDTLIFDPKTGVVLKKTFTKC